MNIIISISIIIKNKPLLMKLLTLSMILVFSVTIEAQIVNVSRDQNSNFVINYNKPNTDSIYTGVFVPGDLVEASIKVSFNKISSGLYKYSYLISNLTSSPVSLHKVEIESNSDKTRASTIKNWYIRFSKEENIVKATYVNNRPPGIIPGGNEDFIMSSGGLPEVGIIRISNLSGSSFPSEIDEYPHEINKVIDSLRAEHSYRIYQTIVASEPKVNKDLFSLIDELNSNLFHSCQELGWITNQGICNSLEVKLQNTKRHLENEKLKPAANTLNAFLHEVEGQKDKAISSEAYALLYFNGQYLLEKLKANED